MKKLIPINNSTEMFELIKKLGVHLPLDPESINISINQKRLDLSEENDITIHPHLQYFDSMSTVINIISNVKVKVKN